MLLVLKNEQVFGLLLIKKGRLKREKWRAKPEQNHV